MHRAGEAAASVAEVDAGSAESAASAFDSPPFLARLKALEPTAIEALYEGYGPVLLRYSYRQTNDWSQAQDIVSEVFLRLLRSIDRYQPRGTPLLAWLYRIARNAAIDQRRRTQHWVTGVDAQLEGWAGKVVMSANALDLAQALTSLSPEHREVVVLRFLEQRSAEDVALILGKSESAVRSLQHRALEVLRQRLGDDYA